MNFSSWIVGRRYNPHENRYMWLIDSPRSNYLNTHKIILFARLPGSKLSPLMRQTSIASQDPKTAASWPFPRPSGWPQSLRFQMAGFFSPKSLVNLRHSGSMNFPKIKSKNHHHFLEVKVKERSPLQLECWLLERCDTCTLPSQSQVCNKGVVSSIETSGDRTIPEMPHTH